MSIFRILYFSSSIKNDKNCSQNQNEKREDIHNPKMNSGEDTSSSPKKGKYDFKLQITKILLRIFTKICTFISIKHFLDTASAKSGKKDTNGHETSKPEKFDQVEDALEAMFGLEELAGKNRPLKIE